MKIKPITGLGAFPTPLHELPRLSAHLGGPPLWIKRDDLSGLALGGNKVRKLRFLLAEAIGQQADTVITAGAAQSNHCRQTAAAAAQMGLECHLLLGGSPPGILQGNLLLDKLLGAQLHWAGDNRKGEDIPALVKSLIAGGKRPYVIPYGGSNTVGAMGYVEAMSELKGQMNEIGQSFSHLVFATGSGGTHTGMVCGARLNGMDIRIEAIGVDKEGFDGLSLEDHVLRLCRDAAPALDIDYRFTPNDVLVHHDFEGDGYGVLGSAEKEAISMLARWEGILLDPVYTGKAFAGLLGLLRTNYFSNSDSILFWHTGGAPALFSYHRELGNGWG